MRAGRLRHRVRIQEATETRDAEGGVVFTWRTRATRWAEVAPLQGNELFRAQQVQSDVTHKILMRTYPNLDTSMRLVFKDRNFSVKNIVDTLEKGKEIQVLAMEDVSR